MPKTARHTLIWSPAREGYELRQQGSLDAPLLAKSDASWVQWLAEHNSLSFQGQHGSLSLLKESRQRGSEGYWYAYQRQGKRIVKKYLGRSAALTLDHLEAVAKTITAGSSPARAASSSRPLPLLAPKLRPPRLNAALIARECLHARLDAALRCKLTLLSAPAGFGKTTLVSQWIASRSQHLPPVAWVALDAGDNDPVRFWDYVITACQAFQPSLGQSALTMLHSAHRPSFEERRINAALTLFLNDLTNLPCGGVLVLEDYHVIAEPQIHEAMTFFLAYLPATLHLIMLTRSDPPFPLARLRAAGDLNELRAADLRFTLEETRAFLQQALPFALAPAAISRLDAQIDGWVTGLRLVALMLQGQLPQPEGEQALVAFAGTQRPLLDYFITEVLEAQPEALQQFLLQTSILNRLTDALCDAVTGAGDSQQLLEAVERANLFLQPLDGSGQWYRYHPLFAEALALEAQRRLGDAALRDCYERASGWYEQQGMLAEAVEAALAAQAFLRAAMLIEHLLEPQQFYEWNEYHTLRRWLERLPEHVLSSYPRLCLRFAVVLLACEHRTPAALDQMEHPLHLAEQAFHAGNNLNGLGEVFAIRAVKTRLQGNLPLAANLAKQALIWLSDREAQWRGTCLSFIAAEHLLAGKLDTARQLLLEARTLFQAAGNHYAIRAGLLALAEVAALEGALHQAAAFYREVLTTAGEDRDDKAKALLGLAQLSYEWNNLDSAGQQGREARELGIALTDETLQVQSSLVLVGIHQARGETQQASHLLDELLARLPLRAPSLQQAILARQARLQLAAGDITAVQRWIAPIARQREPGPWLEREQAMLIIIRLLIAQGTFDKALRLLKSGLKAARQYGRIRSEMELLMLTALAHFAGSNRSQAIQALREVLTLTQAAGYQRLYLDEGKPMEALLRAALPEINEEPLRTYARRLILAFAGTRADAADAANSAKLLSPQEQRVLHLLAAGRSKPEIAQELVVSVNTVKTQVRSIYGKLRAASRKDALDAARQLHIIR